MGYAGRILTMLFDEMGSNFSMTHATKADAKRVREVLTSARMRGIKFIVPHERRVNRELPLLASELRPPFPVTLFEFDMNNSSGLILATDRGHRVELFMALRFDGLAVGWFFCPAVLFADYNDASAIGDDPIWHSTPFMSDRINELIKQSGSINAAAKGLLEAAQPLLIQYTALCQTFKYRHTETIDVEPDAKENRIRRIKRQTPLFTYKTLVIGEPKPKVKGHKGGTHASPRSHLRRGHYRTSKNGIRYWVSAAFVNGAPGFVHKDYKLEGAQ